jgi:hypothetical protein
MQPKALMWLPTISFELIFSVKEPFSSPFPLFEFDL